MEAEIHLGVRDPEDVIKELRADVKNLCDMLTENYKGEHLPSPTNQEISAERWIIPDWLVMARGKAKRRKE
jgi:hypothetical protein